MLPDVAPEDGVQPEPQFVPLHVRVASVSALYLPASQFVQIVEAVAAEYLPASQSVQTAAETRFNVLLVHASLHHSFHVPTIVDASAALLTTKAEPLSTPRVAPIIHIEYAGR
jgi:hypothetical protein